MISIERAYSLYSSVNYICRNSIPGDFIECGVWKGGACMLAGLTLINNNKTDIKIYLYDTFEGMTKPGEFDSVMWNGKKAFDYWNKNRIEKGKNMWAADLSDVENNMASTGYPADNIIFRKGDVKETLETYALPEKISLLRLDTDWYESTKIELETLYPLLSEKGVLIIDDYGHFSGAKKAVDEFFAYHENNGILLNRIDYTGRTGVKFKKEQKSVRSNKRY